MELWIGTRISRRHRVRTEVFSLGRGRKLYVPAVAQWEAYADYVRREAEVFAALARDAGGSPRHGEPEREGGRDLKRRS